MSYRYEKRLRGIGEIRKSTGLDDGEDFTEFCGLMVTLARTRPELVYLFRDGSLSASQLLLAHRREDLSSLIPDARTLVTLDSALEKVFRAHPKADGETVRRYRVSAKKFRDLAPQVLTVRELADVDYDALAKRWPGSPSDWMAFYRMLSHFLTRHFGGKRTGRAHPFRSQVMDLIPRKAEKKRVPAISPAVFTRLVSLTPDYAQPVYQTLLVTGFRVRSEYLRLGREHLRPQVYEIEVPGTKTEHSAAVVPVDPACWSWVERAVPSPIAYGQIRKHWMRACLQEGLASRRPDPCRGGRLRYVGPTLHDIRHLTGQFMTNAGVPESMVQSYLRHSDPATTRRYTMQAIRAEAATAIARAVSA